MAVKIPKSPQEKREGKQLYQPSPHREEVKQLLREGKTPEELATQFPLTERTIYRYLKEIQDEQAAEKGGKVTGNTPASTKVVTTPVQLAVVTTKTPGPIVFRMGDQTIDMKPEHMYDAWRYCEDIKRIEPSIDDDFSLMIKVAAKHLWEYFSQREARRVGVILELEEKENKQ